MIYKVSGQTGNNILSLSRLTEGKHFNDFMFNANKDWQAPIIGWSEPEKKGSINDVIHVFNAGIEIIINENTTKILEKEFNNSFEFIDSKFIHNKIKYYYLNIKNKISNAIDEENSEFRVLRSGSKVLKKEFFKEDIIIKNEPFIIPEKTSGFYIKGNKLENLIKEHNITGFNLEVIQ